MSPPIRSRVYLRGGAAVTGKLQVSVDKVRSFVLQASMDMVMIFVPREAVVTGKLWASVDRIRGMFFRQRLVGQIGLKCAP